LILLHGVETALNRFYNSGKFAERLNYCLGFFETPFDFYTRLSEYMLRRDCLYRPLSSENLFNVLLDFSASL